MTKIFAAFYNGMIDKNDCQHYFIQAIFLNMVCHRIDFRRMKGI